MAMTSGVFFGCPPEPCLIGTQSGLVPKAYKEIVHTFVCITTGFLHEVGLGTSLQLVLFCLPQNDFGVDYFEIHCVFIVVCMWAQQNVNDTFDNVKCPCRRIHNRKMSAMAPGGARILRLWILLQGPPSSKANGCGGWVLL